MLAEITKYAEGMNVQPDVHDWIGTHLKPYIEKNKPQQTEVEHIIDYMASNKRPKRISKMSYAQAKANTDKWNKALIKKGSDIDEAPGDVEVIKKWKDGFRIVKLVGQNAYKREGFLMRHCVAGYYGRSVEIYSLRDKDNMPHCTMERGQQIKGKGNGPIHPKYIKYVVAFLQEIGMTVGDNEMKNLGYVNVEKIQSKLHKTKNKFFNDKYLYNQEEFYGTDGEKYSEFDIWQYKPIVTKVGIDAEVNIKFNFDVAAFIQVALSKLTGKTKKVAEDAYSTAVANSSYSTAVANREDSTAVANSYSSTAVANREDSTAVANSYSSTAVANSFRSTAVANREDSTAVANSYYSTAVANSYSSTAVAKGKNSIALCRGSNSKAKGKLGAWLVIAEYDDNNENIINIVSGKVDGKGLKEDIYYKVENGAFKEAA